MYPSGCNKWASWCPLGFVLGMALVLGVCSYGIVMDSGDLVVTASDVSVADG